MSATDQLNAIRMERDRSRSEHRACIDSSRKALVASRQALNLLHRSSFGLSIVSLVRGPAMTSLLAGTKPGIEPISKAQWLVYFWSELTSMSPDFDEVKAYRTAVECRELAAHIHPETAAITLVAGLSTLH